MMRDPVQTIDVYGFKTNTFRIPRGFELRVEGRFSKFANKLWNYLIKKGLLVQSYEDLEKVERVRIDGRQLFDALYEQYHSLLEACRDPEMAIIGRDTFRKMMHIRELHDYCGGPLSFDSMGEVRGSNGSRRLFNLPVRVVTHMEGVVILDSAQ